MKIIYTKHAEIKLKQSDIKKFKIDKNTVRKLLLNPRIRSKTKYGDHAAVSDIDRLHDLRIIYVIIEAGIKVITFHIARKRRYLWR